MRRLFAVIIITIILFITNGCASTQRIVVQDAWARPGFQGDNSAVYFRISNPTNQGDGLIGADSDIAHSTEIHLSKMDESGTMKMERQDLVGIPARSSTELVPGGLHIMLENLVKDLSVEDTFQLTLEFQRVGDITIEVEVRQTE